MTATKVVAAATAEGRNALEIFFPRQFAAEAVAVAVARKRVFFSRALEFQVRSAFPRRERCGDLFFWTKLGPRVAAEVSRFPAFPAFRLLPSPR